MPRKSGSGGQHHTTKQTGTANRRRNNVGTYAAQGKGRQADRYDRPYIDGSYKKWTRYNRDTGQNELVHIENSIELEQV